MTGGGTSVQVTGSALTAGPGCQSSGGGVSCTAPATGLGYVLIWGGSGNDSLSVSSAFSTGTFIKLDGGPGNDRLDGGPGSDTLWAGESGTDQLFGNAGDDSLNGRTGGGDLLAAGPGATSSSPTIRARAISTTAGRVSPMSRASPTSSAAG